MLVLSRKTNQAIDIIDNGRRVARVIVTDVRGATVRLGFEAEPAVKFLRAELSPRPKPPRAA